MSIGSSCLFPAGQSNVQSYDINEGKLLIFGIQLKHFEIISRVSSVRQFVKGERFAKHGNTTMTTRWQSSLTSRLGTVPSPYLFLSQQRQCQSLLKGTAAGKFMHVVLPSHELQPFIVALYYSYLNLLKFPVFINANIYLTKKRKF